MNIWRQTYMEMVLPPAIYLALVVAAAWLSEDLRLAQTPVAVT